jgi:hypothetical protein
MDACLDDGVFDIEDDEDDNETPDELVLDDDSKGNEFDKEDEDIDSFFETLEKAI